MALTHLGKGMSSRFCKLEEVLESRVVSGNELYFPSIQFSTNGALKPRSIVLATKPTRREPVASISPGEEQRLKDGFPVSLADRKGLESRQKHPNCCEKIQKYV
uniref:Uncharacterized protein n=1 Tax=Physcomitrium patens TaxID=3218 RepID=A0A2K1JK93_PHYPA|nr:hypothetical protein PHYPA_016807 [Physcomitrium patens]